MILYLVYLMAVPALVMLLARRWTWIDKVSPMAVLYVAGLLVANLTDWIHQPGLLEANNLVGNICIPLSIPLMLISCSLTNWRAGNAAKACITGFCSVLIVSVAGYFLFRHNNDPQQFAQISAVAIGIYTGGIPNMGAIARGVGMDNTTYLYITSYDLIVTGLYLMFVICFGKPLFRRLLPSRLNPDSSVPANDTQSSTNDSQPPLRSSSTAIVIALALAIAVASYFLSTLFPDNLSTPMLILLLTTLSIAASFIPLVRRVNNQANQRGSQPVAFTVGLLNILWYILFIIFGSLILQILFARLIHLDGDTTLVTSVTLINSPPFVPLVAALLGNRELIVTGITIGLIGYLVGNYLGLGLFFLLAP